MTVTFAVSAVGIVYTFVFDRAYTEFLIAMPILGFGLFGSLSGLFVYGPELFPTSVRATALAVANCVGRYFTAAGPLVAGVIARTLAPAGTAFLADPGRVGREGFLTALPEVELEIRSQRDFPFVDGKIRQTITVYTLARSS